MGSFSRFSMELAARWDWNALPVSAIDNVFSNF